MSESLKKYYETLELNENASKEDIKRAYRRLALKHHPDKNPGSEESASKMFIAINEAYSILIDSNHIGESINNVDDAKHFFKKNFYDLARRIYSDDHKYDTICQEECDFFFRYQLEEVSCVKRSVIEARRIIDLIKKAITKGYNSSEILKEHSDFFQKYGFNGDPKYNGYEDLIKEYKRFVQEEPNSSNAHYNLGLIYEKCGMFDSAITEYKIASYIDPKSIKVKRALQRVNRLYKQKYEFRRVKKEQINDK